MYMYMYQHESKLYIIWLYNIIMHSISLIFYGVWFLHRLVGVVAHLVFIHGGPWPHYCPCQLLCSHMTAVSNSLHLFLCLFTLSQENMHVQSEWGRERERRGRERLRGCVWSSRCGILLCPCRFLCHNTHYPYTLHYAFATLWLNLTFSHDYSWHDYYNVTHIHIV